MLAPRDGAANGRRLWGFFISKINHRCGIVGFWGVPDAALRTYYALYALQHRGQESAGIVASDRSKIQSKKGLGLISEALDREEIAAMPGDIALGHVRYSTTGARRLQNIQPLVIEYSQGIVAVAHNGNLTNARRLRHRYESRGSIFQTSTDSEVFVHLMADPAHLSTSDPLADALLEVHGAFSLGMMTSDKLVAARDPLGFRPLSIARLEGGYMIASETCAFDLFDAEYIRDVEPGEIVSFSENGMEATRFAPDESKKAQCIFEHVYFARPDSQLFGHNVHQVRRRMGEILAREHPVEADVVTSIPDSGNSAAMGFAAAAGIPLDRGFARNYYVGRTFIMPGERTSSVELKLNPIKEVLAGKRVVVVDDSIVRGTTSRARIAALRKAGARELHFRISAPPIRHGCYFGIDFPDPAQLIASQRSVEEIRDFIGVDSLGYISVDGLLEAVEGTRDDYCTACFTGEYPCRIDDQDMDKGAMERRK
jgi:amidophosphoribosyltransferase